MSAYFRLLTLFQFKKKKTNKTEVASNRRIPKKNKSIWGTGDSESFALKQPKGTVWAGCASCSSRSLFDSTVSSSMGFLSVSLSCSNDSHACKFLFVIYFFKTRVTSEWSIQVGDQIPNWRLLQGAVAKCYLLIFFKTTCVYKRSCLLDL